MKKKILLIEDELLIQKSLKKMLEMRDCQVTVCSTGKTALELILNEEFDRIICDLMLQDITGFDIIEDSKKKYSLRQIQNVFVIITAYCSDSVLAKAQDYKCPVLSKPFENMEESIQIMLGESC